MKPIVENIIVKVQIPLVGYPQVLVYSEGKKFQGVFDYTKELKRELKPIMRGQPKAFAFADVVDDGNGRSTFELNGPAPRQDW